ncbi:MAG: S8 family peptidase [Dehalococcoidia bacterium]|nr:S8 family peptidase [Dehalococcoidia bacterium]
MQQDRFLGEPVVLKEIRDAFAAQGGGKIEVIIGVKWDYKAQDVKEKIKELFKVKDVDIKSTDRFVLVKLSEKQVDELAKVKMVFKIWHNRKMMPMVSASSATIKATAALQLFHATGKKISWAVLDTGIKADHDYFNADPDYFKNEPNVVKDPSYNFTTKEYKDDVGHGTHVAGIIRKIAPHTTIYDFKVLAKGEGTSFGLIEAMYRIRRMNLEARRLIIHGVNMSLGGPVPVGSYGCGFSPECDEANRLVESGVVVCVAASNDGYKTLAAIQKGNKLEYFSTFLDMGISDPGNAEKVITVGSTHKTEPHQYGISYFSSKGPTGDGRFKPDVVAPGEKILSAGIKNQSEEVTQSGTSMATPHVSAAIAQFLSAHPGFKGQPDKIKKILMETCTDLGRDRFFQGAGLIDVLRMIESV